MMRVRGERDTIVVQNVSRHTSSDSSPNLHPYRSYSCTFAWLRCIYVAPMVDLWLTCVPSVPWILAHPNQDCVGCFLGYLCITKQICYATGAREMTVQGLAMADFPADASAIMSGVLEAILYGFSVLMFIGTIWALTYKRQMQDVNRPIAVVAILLLLVSTVHMVVAIIRLENGLVKYRDTWPGGPAVFFADVTEETYVIKHALYIFQTVLADGVMIYRCYVLWQSIRVIILPSLLWCSIIVTGVRAVYGNSQASANPGDVFATNVEEWIIAFIVSTLSTNMLCSGLLVYRIWKIERDVSRVRATKSTVMPIVRVLVDAAVLYSIMLFGFLICFLTASSGESVLSDMVVPIISIAFYMVLIRITINSRQYLSTAGTRRTTDRMEQGNPPQYPMKPMEVHVSQFTQDDSALSSYKVGSEDRPST